MNILYTCPACGYKTRTEESFGSYDICPICNWEDDALQLQNPASNGGANKESLIEFQERIRKNQNENNIYEKDPSWRPFNNSEIEIAKSQKEIKKWFNRGETDFYKAYWIS